MILIPYLILLIASVVIFKKSTDRVNYIALVGIGYVYSFIVLFILLLKSGESGASFLYSLFRIAYGCVQIVTFNGMPDIVDELTVYSISPTDAAFQMQFVAFLSSFITMQAIVIALFQKAIRHSYLEIKSRIVKKQYILIGDEENCRAIADDIRKTEPRALFIRISEPDDNLLWLCKSFTYFERLRDNTEYIVLLLDCGKASSLAKRIDALSEGKNIHLTALMENDIIRFEDLKLSNCDAYLVSKEQLLIRRLMEENRPVTVCRNFGLFDKTGLPLLTEKFGICVIGFGSLGREFLLSTYENAQFLTKNGEKPFQALVIDDSLYYKQQEFFVDAPYFKNSDEIKFVNTRVHTCDYFDSITEELSHIHQIFISTQSTELNIRVALKLCRFFRRQKCTALPQIIVCVHEEYHEPALTEHENIKLLHTNESVFTYEKLVARSFDKAARERNEAHNKSADLKNTWSSLSTFTQNTNRAVAWDEFNKKELIALSGGVTDENRDALALMLAKYEHNRWNAFHHTRGWEVMPVSELTEEERAAFVTKHPEEKRHICLVSWDELDLLPQKEPGILKYYDYQSAEELLK